MATRHRELRPPEAESKVELDSAIWEFDLHAPPLRVGLIDRRVVVDRLLTTDADMVTVVAPAGYGKTTALAQWVGRSPRSTAWLTLGESDNDPRTLMLRLTSAVARAGIDNTADMSWLVALGGNVADSPDNGQLFRALARASLPFTLVLDNVEVLRSSESRRTVKDIVGQAAGRIQIIISSRSDPDLPLARLRAQQRLMELTEEDLAMTEEDVDLLLDGVEGSRSVAYQLTTISGGWPASISLLIASNRTGAEIGTWLANGSEQRVLADYVSSEILPQISKAHRAFLIKVSPLERLSGPLCESVAETSNGSKLLRTLASSTHLLHPVDGPGDWYEMNPVLRTVLRTEFERDDPVEAAKVHAKAAAWYGSHDLPLQAIGHAQKSGDIQGFSDLMTRLIKVHFTTGHVAEVLLWMDWLEQNSRLDEHPDLAAFGALVHIQEGNVLDAETWLDAATRGGAGRDASAVVWLVRASASSSGVEQMLSDIETARELAGPGSAWLPAIIVTKGLAHVMEGRPDLAEPCFVEAAQLGRENRSFAGAVLALGQRALLAIERQDWTLASDLADLAMAIIDEHGLDGYHVSGLPLVAAARCARRKNDIPKAQSLLARASLVRPRLSSAMPGESVEILVEMAKAYVELSDVVGARALIREADDIVLIRPDLGVLPARLEDLKASLADLGPGTVGLSALTRAELRLLPFLATNLSFPEIGEQLFISRHTVKTQAMSIYRKLGTSSRSEAVAKAQEVGLLHR